MDETDVRIFCEMAESRAVGHRLAERQPSAFGIGRRLGLDEKTVRTRIGRMERDGFIDYYQAEPDLGLLGVGSVGKFRLEAVTLATKAKAIERARDMPGTVELRDFMGLAIAVAFGGPSPEAVRQSARDLAVEFEMTCSPVGEYAIEPAAVEPDRLDWRVVQALRYDARCTTRSLALHARVTPRMAEYRLARLMNSGAVQVRAVLNPQRQGGLVFFELEIELDEPYRAGIMAELSRRFGVRFWSTERPLEGMLVANLFGFTLADPEAAALAVLEFGGVRRCSVYLQKTTVEPNRPSWVDRAIEEHLVPAPDPPGAPRRGKLKPT